MKAKPAIPAENPYIGPRPYEYGERIYGRGREIVEIRNLLLYKRIILLHAPSGAGKTSLIQAGLLKELRRQGLRVHLPIIRVNKEPPDDQAIIQAKYKTTYNRYLYSLFSSLEEALPEKSRSGDEELVQLNLPAYLELYRLKRKRLRRKPIENEVWIFDQFEEVLSLDPTDREQKEAFFDQLGKELHTYAHLAIFAMRDDFVGSLEPFLAPIPERLRTRYHLDLLDKDAARQAIVSPARSRRVSFTRGAYNPLIDDLLQTTIQNPDGTPEKVKGLYVEPVQLQVVCQQLWNERQDPKKIRREDLDLLNQRYKTQQVSGIDPDELAELTFVDYALGKYFGDTVAEVAENADLHERNVRDWFTRQLITPRGLRGQVLRGPGESQGLNNKAIEQLVRAHLVRREERRGLVWYELAHDRLVRPVQINNRRWFQSHLELFQRKAIEWERLGRPEASLLAGGEWAEARQVAEDNPEILSPLDDEFLETSRKRIEQENEARRLGLGTNLADVGWGILFPTDEDPAPILQALKPLLDHRRKEALTNRPNYREFTGPDLGFRPGQNAQDWLRKLGVASGPPNPGKVPYYLLIVAPPDKIPFEFQYDLDERFAVGRLYFPPSPNDPNAHLRQYACYAQSVVNAETGRWKPLARRIGLIAPSYPDQEQSKLISENLINPLADSLGEAYSTWQINFRRDAEATRERLNDLLGGQETPALLVSATLGEYRFRPPDLENYQIAQFLSDKGSPLTINLGVSSFPPTASYTGALVATPAGKKPEEASDFFTSADIPDTAHLCGLLALLYGDSTAGLDGPKPSISPLAQRLLGHPRGGALAVIGHVDSAAVLFEKEKLRPELTPIYDCLNAILNGKTAGMAVDELNQRYTSLRRDLLEALLPATQPLDQLNNLISPAANITQLRMAMLDTRKYILLGDPAVRMAELVEADESYQRPVLNEEDIPEIYRPVKAIPVPDQDIFPQEEGAEVPETLVQTVSQQPDQFQPVPITSEPGIQLTFNGLSPSSGRYTLVADDELISQIIHYEKADRAQLYRLRSWYEYSTSAHYGLTSDPNDLSEAGWGIIVPEDFDRNILDALEPLLIQRQRTAGNIFHREPFVYHRGESADGFFRRYDISPGAVDPQKMPYYLLILGEPEQIPYAFQNMLTLGYAVGRLDFAAKDDYYAYAQGVLRAERASLPQRLGLFCPANPDDRHTQVLHNELILPIFEKLRQESRWDLQAFLGQQATHANLHHWLAAGDNPSLMLLTGHGLVDPNPESRKLGGLVCQDWTGPLSHLNSIPAGMSFTAGDLPPDADLTGLICFLYSSFSAGAERLDPGLSRLYKEQGFYVDRPISSDLPRRMLSLASGAAQAVIGLNGPALSYYDPGIASNASSEAMFEMIIQKLGHGSTVGSALEFVSLRYAELGTTLANLLEDMDFGKSVSPAELRTLWADRTDKRNFVLLGDPAVRLPVANYDTIANQQVKMKRPSVKSRLLEPESGGVDVSVQHRMAIYPTAVAHLLDEMKNPYLSVNAKNVGFSPASLEFEAAIKGYTESVIQNISLNPMEEVEYLLLPPLLPQIADRLSENARADLTWSSVGKVEGKAKFTSSTKKVSSSVSLLSRSTLPLVIRDPSTGGWQDLSFCLGAYINPDDPVVQSVLAQAADRHFLEESFSGYAGELTNQIESIYVTLMSEYGINQVLNYESSISNDLISVPLPRTLAACLESKQASGLETALLISSLLEAAGFNTMLTLTTTEAKEDLASMALVRYESQPGSGVWPYTLTIFSGLIGSWLSRRMEKVLPRLEQLISAPQPRHGEPPRFLNIIVSEVRKMGIKPLSR